MKLSGLGEFGGIFRRPPRSKERGPVEATRPVAPCPAQKSPPRSKERGPVEANVRAEFPDTATNLRAQRSAALLKQIHASNRASGKDRPPRSKERGPVEAAFSLDFTTFDANNLRAQRSAALLKRSTV